jgi:hypothetical protein
VCSFKTYIGINERNKGAILTISRKVPIDLTIWEEFDEISKGNEQLANLFL